MTKLCGVDGLTSFETHSPGAFVSTFFASSCSHVVGTSGSAFPFSGVENLQASYTFVI